VAELTFFYGTMNCGKSTLALQIHHNAVQAGKRCLLLTKHDRQGGSISSRIGLAQPATVVDRRPRPADPRRHPARRGAPRGRG
jgi:thymidine kinase